VRVCQAIISCLGPEHIRWPAHARQVEHAREVEESGSGLPYITGYVDGTHIPIVPHGARERVYSFNRKGFHSTVLQAICDKEGRFLNTYVGYLGRVHDARVFCASPIAAAISNVTERESYVREPLVILGDAAYPCTSWLVTPYASEHTPERAVFNKTHSSARMAIERAFGKLKLQWTVLLRNTMYGSRAMMYLCTAACILHNITIDVDEEHGWHPPEDALTQLLADEAAPNPLPDDLALPGQHLPRNSIEAGKLKRDMMCAALQ